MTSRTPCRRDPYAGVASRSRRISGARRGLVMNVRRRIGSPSVLSSAVGIVALAAASLANAGAAQADPSVSIRPVVGGLAAPRGIVFDGRGAMYVSESGVAGGGPAGLTHTGKVDKFNWGSTTAAWRKGFNSLYVTEDPTAPPDVLGPE